MNVGSCASRYDQGRHGFRLEVGGHAESSKAIVDDRSRVDLETTNRDSLLPKPRRLCTQAAGPPNSGALAGFCSSSWSLLRPRDRSLLPVEYAQHALPNRNPPTAGPPVRLP